VHIDATARPTPAARVCGTIASVTAVATMRPV
jgi:hypothetical protein